MNARSPDLQFEPDEPVGQILARLRRERGLTGAQLGKLAGLSQPTISRMEKGEPKPADPNHVRAAATALGVRTTDVQRLVDMADAARNRMTDWRPLPLSLAGQQRDVGDWESAAKTIRVFQPAVVVGLLQTSGYARAVLSKFQAASRHLAGSSSDTFEVGDAVAERLRRQRILDDPTRTFRFVMAETVLINQVCSPIEMAAQITHIRDMAYRRNLTISMVPLDQEWTVPPLHGFVVLDERMVTIDLYNTGIETHGRADARTYRDLFDSYEAQATADTEPIFEKYLKRYVELTRQQV